jgi:hypothetical protein
MQKLMKNWIFTLVGCILLAILATFMFLDGFDVGGLHVVDRMLHLVAAGALVIYTAFVLFPLVGRYGGVLRIFVLGEIAVLLLVALAHACVEWVAVPLICSMEVCAVLGLALWLRATVEIVHAYLSGASGEGRVPLWRLLLCVFLSAVGVWQMADPLIADKHFAFAIGTAAAVMALLFAGVTISNRRASAPARAAKKKEREEKAGDVSGELSAAEDTAALPATTEE